MSNAWGNLYNHKPASGLVRHGITLLSGKLLKNGGVFKMYLAVTVGKLYTFEFERVNVIAIWSSWPSRSF